MLARGTVLRNRYKIMEPIGQGGMGSVYLAEDSRLEGRRCALKAVRIDPDADAQAVSDLQRQFSREASILARLDHPNLPKVSDYFTHDKQDYLVMDFVSGNDLREMITEAKRTNRFLDEGEVLRWARQICDALDYMHRQDPPVLHRDIKPSNIKIQASGLIKLVDFGLVKVMNRDDSRTITVLQGRGTAAYTPLEQYGEDDTHTDVQSDIYALAATLYHLLTNQTPAEAKQRFLKPDSLQPIRALNPAVSERTERAVFAGMAMHPDDRPTDVVEFRELLLLGHNRATDAIEADSLTNNLAALSENRVWLAAAAAATIVAFVATAFSK